MGSAWHDYRIFWREFRENFKTTGAVLPSGKSLARALTRYVAHSPSSEPAAGRSRRILEVGPGTGAVTQQLVRRLQAADSLDMVELNERFVRRLEQRFAEEDCFQAVGQRCRVLHQAVEELPTSEPYDLIVSGLPLNNFSVASVEQILASFARLLRPGGVLSFFEYIAVRPARALVSGSAERARLRGIGAALDQVLSNGEIRRDWIWPNVPPAWVHHVQLKGGANSGEQL